MIDVMIITYNEALNLPHCLSGLQGWVNKIFVIDSGSTDGTVELARQAGAEVVHHDWPGYARQKNWGLDNLPFESPWVLILDADEVVTPELRRELERIAARPVDEVPENGFFLNRLTYFMDRPIRHCGFFPSWNLRLLKRGRGRYEDREVHEHVVIPDPVGYIREPMLHWDRRGLEHYFAKHNRYSTLEARQLFRETFAGGSVSGEANVSDDTRRRRWLKRHVLPRLPMPEAWRFFYIYVFRLGFLDGRAGFEFCKLIAVYDYLLVLKLRELKRRAKRRRARPPELDWPGHALAVPEGQEGGGGPAGGLAIATEGKPVRVSSLSDSTDRERANAPLTPEDYLTRRLGHLVTPGTRVIITGGSGFIGTNLVELYHSAGARVINIDREPPRHPRHHPLWRPVDILDADRLVSVVRDYDPQLFFHLAARTDLDEKAGLSGYASNIEGTANILRAVEGLNHLERLILTSTQLVCRPGYQPRSETDYAPHTLYGKSKVEGEKIIRAWANAPCPWTIVRPTSIWGPWFDVPYRDFFLAVAKRRYVHQRGVNPLRSFGFVGNCIFQYASYVHANEAAVDRRTFYMADYEPVRVRDWANLIQQELGIRPLREIPVGILTVLAKGGDVAQTIGWKEPPLTSFRLRNLVANNYVDMSPVRQVLGEEPYGMTEAVRLTVQWLEEAGLVRRRSPRATPTPVTADRSPVGV